MRKKVYGRITSDRGFYIGDLCYALNRKTYDDVWGANDYEDGIYEVHGTGRSFAVAGTAYGDGSYEDGLGREYGVDAGVLSLVPGELAENTNEGHYFPGAGTATFDAEDGFFKITLPSGEVVVIDTASPWDGDDEEE